MEELTKFSPLITIIVGLVTIGSVLFAVGRWFQKLEAKMDRLDRTMDTLTSWASGFSKEINTFFGVIVQLLSNRQQLTTSELGLVTRSLSNLNSSAVQTLFERERLSRNPLKPEELECLQEYYGRVQAGGSLNWQEVNEYNRLVAILEQERATDPGVWPLVALGAFLVGLMIGVSKEDKQ